MKQIPTPKELLELIKSSLFKEIDIECVLTMSSTQKDTFLLEQQERLLAAQRHGMLASWLSDLFWTADKEAILITTPHPWLEEGYELKDPKDMSDLNCNEYELAEWILNLAALSHDLIVHANFPLDILEDGLDGYYKDDKDNFSYAHKPLIEWIRSTPSLSPHCRISLLSGARLRDQQGHQDKSGYTGLLCDGVLAPAS